MKGEPEYPVSDQELKRKFDSLAGDAVSPDHAEKLWQAVFHLGEGKNIAEVASLMRGAQ